MARTDFQIHLSTISFCKTKYYITSGNIFSKITQVSLTVVKVFFCIFFYLAGPKTMNHFKWFWLCIHYLARKCPSGMLHTPLLIKACVLLDGLCRTSCISLFFMRIANYAVSGVLWVWVCVSCFHVAGRCYMPSVGASGFGSLIASLLLTVVWPLWVFH